MIDFSKPYALDSYFGNIDIYLFDQMLKGRIQKGQKILDAGCGGGRNLVFMIRQGFDLYGVDQNPLAITHIQALYDELEVGFPQDHFKVEALENMSFTDQFFDVIICNAVLHFAKDVSHFEQMLTEMWRVLKPGGMLFARLATDITVSDHISPLGNRRFALGDGSERFLASKELLLSLSQELGATWIEPLKTVNVDNLRAMTTIVWKR